MISLKSSRNYVVIKEMSEVRLAKQIDFCMFIVLEEGNVIYLWSKVKGIWNREKYVCFGESKDKDYETTGLKAYQAFYSFCGKEEVEKMKHILSPIPIWESHEQLHYFNFEFMNTKLYQKIYEFDANSAFTYGVTRLPKGFELLKEYMLELYNLKETAKNKITRSKYKNLQNYLIGYFARVKEFIRVRSDIIKESNQNIQRRMAEIISRKGKCFISNTDSIITDEIGAEVMENYKGDNVGQFKINAIADKLYYKSSNIYQLGDKVKYSGVKYFARQHTDFFKDEYAEQKGSLIQSFDFILNMEELEYQKLCKVRFGEIEVTTVNLIGEVINITKYKIGE